MNKTWKLVLLVAGIFVAGAVVGGVVTFTAGRHFLQKRMHPESQWPNRLKQLADKLALTPEQQDKLRPIVKRDMEELAHVRDTALTESRKIFDRMEQDIAAQLTPEQKVKFEEIKKERRERLERFGRERPFGPGGTRRLRDRPPGGGPGDADGPPPPPPDQHDKPPGDS